MQLSLLPVFALACGAVSVAVMWQLDTAFRDAVRAKSWAVLPAEVQLVRRADEAHGVRPLVRYAYRVAGQEYTSTRLGIAQINGAEGVGDWREHILRTMEDAREGHRPISVFVNPGDPTEAVVDRQLRAAYVVSMLPWLLFFGGLGGAMAFAIRSQLRPAISTLGRGVSVSAQGPIPAENEAGGMLGLAAFLWCGVVFPVAALHLPDMIAAGEWAWVVALSLLVVVGAGMLAMVLIAQLARLKYGQVLVQLDTGARAGSPISGAISFSRGVRPGDRWQAELACSWWRLVQSRVSNSGSSKVWQGDTLWVQVEEVAVTAGATARFRFEPPADMPGAWAADSEDSFIRWRLRATDGGALRASNAFNLVVDGPAFDAAAVSRLMPVAHDPSKAVGPKWLAYALAGALVLAAVGVALFMFVDTLSALLDFATRAFG